MVKNLHVVLDDKDYDRIKKAKGTISWRDFLMEAAIEKRMKNFQENFEDII